MSRREVRRRLVEQGSGTNLAGLLSGRLDLKLRHVLDLSRVLGLEPLEFFRIVFKEPDRRSPLLQKLEGLVAPDGVQAAVHVRTRVPARDFEELRLRVAKLTRDVEQLKAAANQSRPR
ncbi:MAG TPA: hypothetical protein VHQ90_08465 [Thermoanaerobaculia bacterium]|nr:hypothetical protein [Thermoanaerobaculia bacterium]